MIFNVAGLLIFNVSGLLLKWTKKYFVILGPVHLYKISVDLKFSVLRCSCAQKSVPVGCVYCTVIYTCSHVLYSNIYL